MNTHIYKRLVLILGINLMLLCMISCKKNEETAIPDKVTLLSFGPSGVKPGDKISFIGYHLDRVTAIELTGAKVEASAFVEKAADHITITVPQETLKGKVTLKAPEGDIVSKSLLNLDVPVTVTDIPATATKGSNISIKGTFVNWITRVTFGNDASVTTFVSKSLTEIVLQVPNNAKTGTLIFSVDGFEPKDIESDDVVVIQ
ncbi:hypothetical protein DVR12_15635 [Chitinophaga silvatica]|uniref:IPT/TIG domain-containing protein n=1 Tax=Chitinophaga silvatica TaxID=2282649 RepID=A0A3E1Y7Z4_9BACT|nr:hypothetical protein [Chitinophaga silvatica]RFS21332.1 hypothetical protein DVR12_15635 [Chitinophaga silvatica]